MYTKDMKKVFVSGCYDVLHAGHVTFFEDAKSLGDHLTVCFATNDVLKLAKRRISSIPEDHKQVLIASLKPVDVAVKSSNLDPLFDFMDHLHEIKPDIWVVTDDDNHISEKEKVSKELGIQFVVLPKRRDNLTPVSTTSILAHIKNVIEVPLRVDFAGGWLDVPRHAKEGTYIVNCTITPKVSLENWPYNKGAGLGGSAAYSLLQVKNGLNTELDLGVGWQDPAVIEETGLCVWRSGQTPVLEFKSNPDWLEHKMLILWTGSDHSTPDYTDKKRDYEKIAQAGAVAKVAVLEKDFNGLCEAIQMSYEVQIEEGMNPLPDIEGARAKKYLGGGYGGYALYMFPTEKSRDKALNQERESRPIEPYIRIQNML